MEVQKLIEQYFLAVITGTFTLLGAILGVVLTEMLKKGKLILLDKSIGPDSISIQLWIYNSADNIKSISDLRIKILSYGKEETLDWVDPKKNIRHYNFNPKQITEISSEFKRHIGDIYRITFTFREINGREKHFTIYENPIVAYLNDGFWTRFIDFISRIKFLKR